MDPIRIIIGTILALGVIAVLGVTGIFPEGNALVGAVTGWTLGCCVVIWSFGGDF